MSFDCVVIIVAGLWGERSEVWITVGARYFLLPQGVRFMRYVLSPAQWVPSFFFPPRVTAAGSWSYLRLVPTLRMSWAMPLLPLYAFMSWTGKKFTFNLLHVYVYRVFIIWRCVNPLSCWTSEGRFAFQACSQCRWLVWFEILRYWDVEILSHVSGLLHVQNMDVHVGVM